MRYQGYNMSSIFMNVAVFKEEKYLPIMYSSCGTQINKILHDATLM